MSDELERLIGMLKGLEERELLGFFNAATEDRLGNWFIGRAEYNPTGEGLIAPPESGWDVRILAPHDPNEYDADWDHEAPFVREGFCSTCGTALSSYAKCMKCPVCRTACRGS